MKTTYQQEIKKNRGFVLANKDKMLSFTHFGHPYVGKFVKDTGWGALIEAKDKEDAFLYRNAFSYNQMSDLILIPA